MNEILQFVLSAVFILAGIVVILTALLGVFRFRFVMNRMHCAAMIDSFGIVCILIGLMFASGQWEEIWKLLAVVALLWIGSPLSSHLVSRLEISTDETVPEHMGEKENGSV